MKTAMLRRVRRLYNVDYVPRETNRANQLKWVRSVRLLGKNWLLAEYISRKVISNAQTPTQA
jgi:hypothetical protein